MATGHDIPVPGVYLKYIPVVSFDLRCQSSIYLYELLVLCMYTLVHLPNVEHLYLRHIAVDALDRYQPDTEVSYHDTIVL